MPRPSGAQPWRPSPVSPRSSWQRSTGMSSVEVSFLDMDEWLFELADVADIVVDTVAGRIGVAGVPAQALTWGDLAARAADVGEQLDGEFDFHQDGATFPFGAHIAVVEVDTGTGKVRLVRHVAVDDCGTVLAPLLVEGQQHGGIAAGVGQALFEEVRFDDDGSLWFASAAVAQLEGVGEDLGKTGLFRIDTSSGEITPPCGVPAWVFSRTDGSCSSLATIALVSDSTASSCPSSRSANRPANRSTSVRRTRSAAPRISATSGAA